MWSKSSSCRTIVFGRNKVRAVDDNPAAVDTTGNSRPVCAIERHRHRRSDGHGRRVAVACPECRLVVKDMTASKGFIAPAALTVAKWKPVPPGSRVCRRRPPWPGGEAGEALPLVHASRGSRRAVHRISRPAALLRSLLSGGLGFALRAEQEHYEGSDERGNSTVGNGAGNPRILHQ